MTHDNPANSSGAAARAVATDNDDAAKESLIGTDRGGRSSNVSWGAVFAGVVTFLAVTVLLSLVTAGIGLGGAGVGAGIWSVIALALALAAAGYVAGALAVRSGLLHGFLTWATSLVVALALTVALSASLLGAVGGVVSSATQALGGTDVTQVVEDVQGNVDEEDVENAQDQADEALENAQQTAEDAAATAQAGAWWGFVGLLLGAVIAALGGMFGVRSVISRRDNEAVTVRTSR